jgi:hypothetical protein
MDKWLLRFAYRREFLSGKYLVAKPRAKIKAKLQKDFRLLIKILDKPMLRERVAASI